MYDSSLLGLLRVSGNVQCINRGLPFRRFNKIEKQVDSGRLPGSIGAQQTKDVAFVNGKVQSIQGSEVAVLFGEVCRRVA